MKKHYTKPFELNDDFDFEIIFNNCINYVYIIIFNPTRIILKKRSSEF